MSRRFSFAVRAGALFSALALCLHLAGLSPPAYAEEELSQVYANAYIVMDADSGQVLLSHNADERHFPASITKIMTLALALEACLDDYMTEVTVSDAAIAAVGPGSSMISLRPGEVLRVSDLLYATMLASANDAANVLGEYAAGSLEDFVQRMNNQAQALGMTDTHFVNPSGYHDDAHYTTARDFALLIQWALTVPGFQELLGALEYTMPATNLTAYPRHFTTDNSLLLPGGMHYEGTIGGKSGWTPEANYTMTEVVQQDGHTLIVVVLDCPRRGERCADCARLLRYCAEHFQPVAVEAVTLDLPEVKVWHNNRDLGPVPLVTVDSVFLPAGYTMEHVRLETTVPHWYVPFDTFDASVSLIDRATGETLCTFPLTPDPVRLEEMLAYAPEPEVSTWTKQDGMTAAAGCAIIAVLAMLLNWNAAFGDAVRRQAGQRAILRLRARLPAEEKEPPEEAPDAEPLETALLTADADGQPPLTGIPPRSRDT